MSAPVVLCIDFDSYISAIAAMEHIAEGLEACAQRTKLETAVQDFRRAHAYSVAVESHITTPALLRRQVG